MSAILYFTIGFLSITLVESSLPTEVYEEDDPVSGSEKTCIAMVGRSPPNGIKYEEIASGHFEYEVCEDDELFVGGREPIKTLSEVCHEWWDCTVEIREYECADGLRLHGGLLKTYFEDSDAIEVRIVIWNQEDFDISLPHPILSGEGRNVLIFLESTEGELTDTELKTARERVWKVREGPPAEAPITTIPSGGLLHQKALVPLSEMVVSEQSRQRLREGTGKHYTEIHYLPGFIRSGDADVTKYGGEVNAFDTRCAILSADMDLLYHDSPELELPRFPWTRLNITRDVTLVTQPRDRQ